ncbi:hypothetical protein [Aequorivita sp. Q41]|uniref:hypothetical protein n=1 Tax=Aequorivita sp. Q41 TaxID=3153300 RepID=UPI003242FC70
MTKKLAFILFIFLGITVTAQIPTENVSEDIGVFPNEKVELSINSNVVLAGELLQYKAFSLNVSNTKSDLSKVLYVSMRNDADSIVFNHKLKIKNGTASGDFFIPSTLKTGIYRLIGYTNFSRNNTQDAFTLKNIYVVNTFLKNESVSKNRKDSVVIKSKEILSLKQNQSVQLDKIAIATDKKTYGLREKVTLNLKSTLDTNDGNFVLSVRKINPISISDYNLKSNNNTHSGLFFIPELRGELLSGVVIAKENNLPVANKVVSLTIPGKDYVFKMAKTNANGQFFFSISENYDVEKSIVQLNGTKSELDAFSVQIDDKNLKIGEDKAAFLKLNSDIKEWLNERSVQLQIENAYFDTKKDSILPNTVTPPFYKDLGTLFLLDDYTRFPSVKETFVEIVALAAIRGSGADAKFIVNNEYDPNNIAKFYNIDPLVLMDGMQIQDNEELINYNARDINSVRVVSEPYRYGPKLYSGIIAVETKSGDFKPRLTKNYVEELNLAPAVKEKSYFSPDYSQMSTLSRIPDYRVQLLWHPDIQFENNQFSKSFYTSDVAGDFEITLEGFSSNGTFISSRTYFSVSEN